MYYFTLTVLFILFIITFLSRQTLKREIILLDYSHTLTLKGIGAILVLLSHIGNAYGIDYFNPLGGIGVALFLIVSGYGLNESYKKNDLKNFFQKRLTNVLIPYWIVVIFYWLVNTERFNIQLFVQSILLLHKISLNWFVYYILGWYFIFYIVKRYLKNDFWFLFVSLMALFFITENHIGEQAFSITIGIFISKNEEIKEFLSTKKDLLTIIFLSLGVIFSILFFWMKTKGLDIPSNYLIFNILQGVMKTSLALGIIEFTSLLDLFLYKGLLRVGKFSFEIYLVHAQILDVLGNNLISIVVFLTVLFVVSIFVHVMSNRIKHIGLYSLKSVKKQ